MTEFDFSESSPERWTYREDGRNSTSSTPQRHQAAVKTTTAGTDMAIDSTSRKILWGRSANLCAFTGCKQTLSENLQSETTERLELIGVPIGEEAHIISGSPGGPRYDKEYPTEKINSYENLILLCPTHHSLIDKRNGEGFSVKHLRKLKRDHEAAQSSMRSPQDRKRDEIEYHTMALIEIWTQKARLAEWESLTSKLNSPLPRLTHTEIKMLTDQTEWAMKRNIPAYYPQTAKAFRNYTTALRDTVNHIHSAMELVNRRDEVYEIYREWKHRHLDTQEDYDATVLAFEQRCAILGELSLHLTKSANLICDAVRLELDPLFRFSEGAILHRTNDGISGDSIAREEYEGADLDRADPYPGYETVEGQILARFRPRRS